jgi:uncharacterized protein (DUF2237 family)
MGLALACSVVIAAIIGSVLGDVLGGLIERGAPLELVPMQRWLEALEAGVAPPVVLESTHARVLDFVKLEVLRRHAYAPA